jgi:hypothetical protein
VAKRKESEDICSRPNKIFCSALNNVPDAQDLQISDIQGIGTKYLRTKYLVVKYSRLKYSMDKISRDKITNI